MDEEHTYSCYDDAIEVGIRMAIAFFRDKIGKETPTDILVEHVLDADDNALQGSL